MEKGDRQNGGPEQIAGSREPQRAARPVPGKVTRTSKLSPGRGPAVQRKAVAPAAGAAPPARSLWDLTMDPWMDAAHRGVTALAERAQDTGPIQAKGEAETPEGPAHLPGHGGGGAEMPGDVRGKMETAFGADFSQVRIHEGPHAEAIGAQAYTQGTDIHFAPGRYQPSSQRGQELLGHELTHVVQQSQGRVSATTQAKRVGINDDASLEREADELGARAARGEPAVGSSRDASGPRHGSEALTSKAAPVQKHVIQRFEENEHQTMGNEGAGGRKIKLRDDLEVSFGDITAMAGDYFTSVDEIKQLLSRKGDGKNCPGTADEIIFVLRVNVNKQDKEELYGADLRKVVKERFYRLASFNPTHFTNVEVGDEALSHEQRAGKRAPDGKTTVNNAGSYRQNHIEAIKAAVAAGKAGKPNDDALLYESFASHFLTDAYSAGHVRTQRISIESWWNARVPMFWTNLHWWMAEQIAKHINAKDVRGYAATVDYMWQEARATIAKKLKEKGIPNMTFGNVISGAVHDVDNADGVMAQVGNEVVKLVGDGQVLDERGKRQAAGVETGKKAAAGVKASLLDIDEAYAKGKAGASDAEAVIAALKTSDGLFRAEQLWPKALPDSAAGQTATPKWQHDTVDQLLVNAGMRKALQRFANNKAATLGKEMKMEEQYEEDALHQGVLARLKGDETQVAQTFREIIDYIPDTGGHGTAIPLIAQSPIDHNSDDNAMEYYQEAKAKNALGTLTSEQRFKAIRFLIAGSCDDDEEQAIIEMLDTTSVADMVSIVSRLGGGDVRKGIEYLDSGIDGEEWDTLCNQVLSKSPTTAVHVDDDGARAAVAAGKHAGAGVATKQGWIEQLMDGSCTDEDEAAIIRILESSAPGDVVTIVNGVGYGRLWNKIDGAENMQLTKVLHAKGYFKTWSQGTMIHWVKFMSDGPTNNNAQELICSILESASKAEVKAIIDTVGSLDWDLTGSHQDRYDAVKKAHGLN